MAYKLHFTIYDTDIKKLISDEKTQSSDLLGLLHFFHSIIELEIADKEALPLQSNGSNGDRLTETTDGDKI